MCGEKGLFVWGFFKILSVPHAAEGRACYRLVSWTVLHNILCAQECVSDVHRELTMSVCLGPHSLLWAGTEKRNKANPDLCNV